MLVDTISQDINAALKAGDKPRAEALRLLKGALMNARIAAGHDLTDPEAEKVIRKEMKSRVEARDLFAANDRAEQAAKEEYERSVYATYVPEQLNEAAIDALIAQAATEQQELQFSQLMPATMKLTAGKADGKLVAERVKLFLEQKAT